MSPIARPFLEYTSRLVDLHELIRAGRDESVEGESLRDSMDYWWQRMSPAEIEQAGQLSEDLYYIHEPPSGQIPFKKEIWAEIQPHLAKSNWMAAIQSIRTHRSEIPAFVASFFEGH